MASKSVCEPLLKYCLKVLLILGVFPWKFDEVQQTLQALDLKLHLAIVSANYMIWSFPFDIHYYPYIVRVFSENISNSEIEPFQYIIRRLNSFVFYVALPIVYHVTCMSLRQKFCQFYETNQKRFNLYNVTWTINNLKFCLAFCFLLVSNLSLLYSGADSFYIITLSENEALAVPIAFGIIREVQSLLFMCAVIPIILYISSALFSWIKTLKDKMLNEKKEELVNQTLFECLELIQACEEFKNLFPKYLKWMVFVGLLSITNPLLNLCEALVDFWMKNPQTDIANAGNVRAFEYVMGQVSILAFSMAICFGIFIYSNTIKNGLKQLQLILKKTYFPRRMKMKWKGKEVPARFIVQKIVDDIERFQGFISIGSSSVVIWFFTFFLFFLQFGIESPSDNLTCFCNCTQ